jgi:hypothetical protein
MYVCVVRFGVVVTIGFGRCWVQANQMRFGVQDIQCSLTMVFFNKIKTFATDKCAEGKSGDDV